MSSATDADDNIKSNGNIGTTTMLYYEAVAKSGESKQCDS